MSKNKLIIVCFYWQGDRWQDKNKYKIPKGHINHHQIALNRSSSISNKLAAKYINNLFYGIKRFLDLSFDFICFTNEIFDLESEIEIRAFPIISQCGVLPRLYMYSEESGLFGYQVLALDLDVIIVGSLNDIAKYNGNFCARSKFKPGLEHLLDGDVISFKAGSLNCNRLWKPFIKKTEDIVNYTKGRERFLYRKFIGNQADRWDNFAPDQIISYKRHVKGKKTLPLNARIVSCHGKPRPHEINEIWRKQYWN